MAKNDEAARREMKAARRALNDSYQKELAAAKRERRKPEETDEFNAANARVIRAEEAVSWWRR